MGFSSPISLNPSLNQKLGHPEVFCDMALYNLTITSAIEKRGYILHKKTRNATNKCLFRETRTSAFNSSLVTEPEVQLEKVILKISNTYGRLGLATIPCSIFHFKSKKWFKQVIGLWFRTFSAIFAIWSVWHCLHTAGPPKHTHKNPAPLSKEMCSNQF